MNCGRNNIEGNRYCPSCGRNNIEGKRYCPSCGPYKEIDSLTFVKSVSYKFDPL